MRRTRLSKSLRSRKKERLPELKQSVTLMSNKELQNLAGASLEKRLSDPILASLSSYAKEELKRRKELEKVMGSVPPRVPQTSPAKEFAAKFAEEVEHGAKEYFRFTKYALTGGLADELTKFMDDLDKTLEKRLFTTKEKWEEALKKHNILRQTESDYLRKGFVLKSRLKYDIDSNLVKAHIARYSKDYKHVVAVPVKVDGTRYYSLLVR